jgi:hypothetical protein
MSPTSWSRFFMEFRCSRCGSPDGFVSRPRNLFERYGLRLLALRPARCGECYGRSYRPARVPLFPHPEQLRSHPSGTSRPGAQTEGIQKGTNEKAENVRRIA